MKMKNSLSVRTLPVIALLAGACASSDPPQVMTGKVALSTFPATPTAIRAIRGGETVTEAPLAADGRFRISLPAHARYHLEVVTPGAHPIVAFPRQAGGLETGFRVARGGRPFGLGTVRYVGDPARQTYIFQAAATTTAAENCEDGRDASTQAVCVNDEGEGEQNQEGVDEAEGADNQCGLDEAEGANNQGGADEMGGENIVTNEAAVGDFNVPPSLGCDGAANSGD
jgi:hypothetical protein